MFADSREGAGAADFLAPTQYCQSDHRAIRRLAGRFCNAAARRETALGVFTWVRDEILYQVGHWNRTALQTLEEGRGTCTTKTNLLVALLRALGIPAGYGVKRVNGKEYFGPLCLPEFREHISSTTRHVYAYVLLDGRWMRCDPSDDRALCEATAAVNPQSQLVEWDGRSDAELNLHPAHVFEDVGPLANIDAYMTRPARPRAGLFPRAHKLYFRVANAYIAFLREACPRDADPDRLRAAFHAWLSERDLVGFAAYRANASYLNGSAKLAGWLDRSRLRPALR